VCGAADPTGAVAAIGRRDASGAGWEVLLWDPNARAPLRTLPLQKRPIDVRFDDPEHVDVRLASTDAALSLSHWHRFRVADGAAVGEPVLCRVSDDDGARKRVRERSLSRASVEPGPEPCVFREQDAVSWWKDGVSVPIADFAVRDVALTADGRFTIVWLPSRLVAIPAGGGDPRTLPVTSETIRAIDAGANGDELVVVTADAVRVLRVGTSREIRNVPLAAERASDAALAPGGGLLAIAFAFDQKLGFDQKVVLLDLDSGRVKHTTVGANTIAWTPDGRRLACAPSPFCSVDREGNVLGESVAGGGFGGNADFFFGLGMGRDVHAHLAALDGDTDVWSWCGRTVCVTMGKEPDKSTSVPFVVREQLSPREVIATDGMRLRICELQSWESIADFDLRADAGMLGIARAARRIAVVAGPEIVVVDLLPPK
jgi:hypothetical protein